MSKIILVISCFLLAASLQAQSVYSYSVISIEGNSKPLSAYQGKKILIITLPTQQNAYNDSLLHSLDSIRVVYHDSLAIIAVPSYEDGYTAANKSSLQQWYRSILNIDIVVTEGMYTRKISGTGQHPLFAWLTDKNKNNTFNQDVTGPGNKFIVWKDGELTSVLGAPVKLGGHTINDLLTGQ